MLVERDQIAKYTFYVVMLSVISSSLFYNRVEGVVVVALILFVFLAGFKSLKASMDKSVKELFLINVMFALSTLLTAFPIFQRDLTSIEDGFEYFFSIVGSSLVGGILYLGFMRYDLSKYLKCILIALGLLLCAYVVWYMNINGGRVNDLSHRNVHNVGFLYSLLAITFLSTYPINSPRSFITALFVVFTCFFIVFYGIQSRALTLAFGLGLLTLAMRFTLRYKLRYVGYILFSLITILAIFFHVMPEGRFQRYLSISSMLSTTFNDLSHMDSTMERSGSIDDQKQRLSEGKQKSLYSAEDLGDLAAAIDQKSAHIQDASLFLRYKMLIIGSRYALASVMSGHGNVAEKELVSKYIGEAHPHLHNQYLSYLVSGGILHLIFGLTFSFGALVVAVKNNSQLNITLVAPIFVFLLFLLFVGAHNQLLGFQTLYIYYSFILLGILNGNCDNLKFLNRNH